MSHHDCTLRPVDAELVFNVRAVGDPEEIRAIAGTVIDERASTASVDVQTGRTQSFRPEYPESVHRMDADHALREWSLRVADDRPKAAAFRTRIAANSGSAHRRSI